VSSPVAAGASRRRLLVVIGVVAAVVVVLAVVLLGRGGDDDTGTATDADVEAADDADAARTDEAQHPDSTSAADGPEGTRNFADVPDEFPDGLVPDDARDIEGTAARGGDDWSAVVVFRTADDRSTLERRIDDATGAAGFIRRNAVQDSERRVIRYDGADGSVLSVTLRSEGDEQIVGAALVSG
jgi:hypothetical protein